MKKTFPKLPWETRKDNSFVLAWGRNTLFIFRTSKYRSIFNFHVSRVSNVLTKFLKFETGNVSGSTNKTYLLGKQGRTSVGGSLQGHREGGPWKSGHLFSHALSYWPAQSFWWVKTASHSSPLAKNFSSLPTDIFVMVVTPWKMLSALQ